MKLPVIPSLDIDRCDTCGTDLADVPGERSEYVASGLSTGGCKVVLTAFVRKEGRNFLIKGIGRCNQHWAGTYFGRSANRLCEFLRLQGDKVPYTVTLKIEPVNASAKVDAASGGVIRHQWFCGGKEPCACMESWKERERNT